MIDDDAITSEGSPDEPEENVYAFMIQKGKVSANFGREQLHELGRRGPFHRYVTFPAEVAAPTGCL